MPRISKPTARIWAACPAGPETVDLEVLPYHRLGKDKYAMGSAGSTASGYAAHAP